MKLAVVAMGRINKGLIRVTEEAGGLLSRGAGGKELPLPDGFKPLDLSMEKKAKFVSRCIARDTRRPCDKPPDLSVGFFSPAPLPPCSRASSLIEGVFVRSRLLWITLLASLLLSGCVQYDVGVNFDNPNHGEIVQHIKLGERLTSFSGDSIQEWLNSIERRARQLEGKIRRSNQEITVTIPFNNGAELEEKFNEFFNLVGKKNSESVTRTATELPSIDSQLSLFQNNFLLLLRNRLSYDLDLRSLSLISTNGNLLFSPGEILELEFSLNTPWGARSIESENAIHPESQKGRQLVWTLKPGQLNHVEAVFWLPSPIGIGTVLIALLVAAGIYLRYNFMPDPKTIRRTQSAIPESQ